MPQIHALRQSITVNGSVFPIYVGFLPASELISIAVAPAFTSTTTHQQIATNILNPPINDWQRPIDNARVRKIADIYSNSNDIMPNPVLLSENPLHPNPSYQITPLVPASNCGAFIIDVQNSGNNQDKPLWILDGQHRISGLAMSSQSANPIPLVLLLNHGGQHYSGDLLAKIFAQVTTEAKKLDNLHDAWLTYAFKLDEYHNDAERQNSMETVANLCKTPRFSASSPANPFNNRIQFNGSAGSIQSPQPGGFDYTCVELAELIYKYYYSCAAPIGSHLPPRNIAEQIVLAHKSLIAKTPQPHSQSVFFSDNARFGQRIMQDAFLVGVMSYLLSYNTPTSWDAILTTLKFDTTNWNFSTWIDSLSGRENTRSKKLAIKIFQKMFSDQVPPTPSISDLSNYLQGDSASVSIILSHLSNAGRPRTSGRQVTSLPASGTRSHQSPGQTHIKLVSESDNISEMTVHDNTFHQGAARNYAAELKRGLILDDTRMSKPWTIHVTSHHYGGITSELKLTISW